MPRRFHSFRVLCALGSCVAVLGCAGAPAAPASPPDSASSEQPAPSEAEAAPAPTSGQAPSSADSMASGEAAPAAPAETAPSGSAAGAAPPPGTPLDARPADPTRSLPEIAVRHVGMHIGGGPNDAEGKRPFLSAIETQNGQFLRCYRLVRSPLHGGTFGVDLFVSGKGGTADVQGTRQRLGGGDFESCMVDAFNAVRFPRPGKPTTLSYSLRFDVKDRAQP